MPIITSHWLRRTLDYLCWEGVSCFSYIQPFQNKVRLKAFSIKLSVNKVFVVVGLLSNTVIYIYG